MRRSKASPPGDGVLPAASGSSASSPRGPRHRRSGGEGFEARPAPSASEAAFPRIAPGAGCLAAPATWVLRLSGQPVRCVTPQRLAPGSAPTPLSLLAEVEAFLRLRGDAPARVVVGADCDPLLSGPEVEAAVLAAAERLVTAGVGLVLCTRGAPGPETPWGRVLLEAVERGAEARVELRLFSLDPRLAQLYEPAAPPPAERLRAARDLAGRGVGIEGRIDPLLPWISDTVGHLEEIVEAFARLHATDLRASYLHLPCGQARRGGLGRLPAAHQAILRGSLGGGPTRPGVARLLPSAMRQDGYARLRRIAEARGLHVTVCREANPDLGSACPCLGGAVADAPRERAGARGQSAQGANEEVPRRRWVRGSVAAEPGEALAGGGAAGAAQSELARGAADTERPGAGRYRSGQRAALLRGRGRGGRPGSRRVGSGAVGSGAAGTHPARGGTRQAHQLRLL